MPLVPLDLANLLNKHLGEQHKVSVMQAEGLIAALTADVPFAQSLVDHVVSLHGYAINTAPKPVAPPPPAPAPKPPEPEAPKPTPAPAPEPAKRPRFRRPLSMLMGPLGFEPRTEGL